MGEFVELVEGLAPQVGKTDDARFFLASFASLDSLASLASSTSETEEDSSGTSTASLTVSWISDITFTPLFLGFCLIACF